MDRAVNQFEELFTFRVREKQGVFDYRGVRPMKGGFRLEKRGIRPGNWHIVINSADEQALVRAFRALTSYLGGKLEDSAPPAWIAERLAK